MTTWTRRPQEQDGEFLFSGAFFVTQGVLDNLSVGEILTIYYDIQKLVHETGGIFYFQTYENDAGDKLYFIDQCEPDMMGKKSFDEELNYCTLLFDHEY